MTITSVTFFLFFLVVLLLSFLLGYKGRKLLLLVVSLIFIGSFNVLSLSAVVVFSVLNFLAGKIMARNKVRMIFLFFILTNILAIIVNNFILQRTGLFSALISTPGYLLNVFVAVGVSFYSLSHIAYLTDVRKGRLQPEQNLLDFLLFSAYFPKMLAGPVTLFQQFRIGETKPIAADLYAGSGRIVLGLLKKVVLADRVAPCVVALFDNPDNMPGINVLMAGFLFTVQLYFDFSGYTDIALGCSRMLGIVLPENFSLPLRSASVTMFWRRWHQSLLHFFSTYIFYPVSFYLRRRGKVAVCAAIVVTFGISALWHGINITFFIWGLCHIIFLLVEYLAGNKSEEKQMSVRKGIKFVYVAITLFLVSFSNIFFRAGGGSEVKSMFANFVNAPFFPASWFRETFAIMAQGGHQQNIFNLVVTFILSTIFLFIERRINTMYFNDRPKWLLIVLTVLIILVFGVLGNTSQFIYAQFT